MYMASFGGQMEIPYMNSASLRILATMIKQKRLIAMLQGTGTINVLLH